jgi:paraquat-inducible protein B
VRMALRLKLSALDITGVDGRERSVDELVRRGLRARLASQSVVTGQKAIELDFVPGAPLALHGPAGQSEIPALADRFGPLIEQVAQLPLRDTIDDFRGAVQDLRDTLRSVQGSLDGAQSLIGSASSELKATAAESRRTLATATAAIGRMQQDSAETLASITRLSNASQQTVQQAQPELMRAIAGFNQATVSARQAMDQMSDLAAPGAPLRSDLEGSARDLSQAARSLKSFSEQLEDRPNALLFGRGQR